MCYFAVFSGYSVIIIALPCECLRNSDSYSCEFMYLEQFPHDIYCVVLSAVLLSFIKSHETQNNIIYNLHGIEKSRNYLCKKYTRIKTLIQVLTVTIKVTFIFNVCYSCIQKEMFTLETYKKFNNLILHFEFAI